AVSVPLSGVTTLRLVVTDAGNGNAFDHADWADAKLTCTAGADTSAPVVTGVIATPAITGATVAWTTNEPATSQIDYGTTSVYGSSSTLDSTLGTAHSQDRK